MRRADVSLFKGVHGKPGNAITGPDCGPGNPDARDSDGCRTALTQWYKRRQAAAPVSGRAIRSNPRKIATSHAGADYEENTKESLPSTRYKQFIQAIAAGLTKPVLCLRQSMRENAAFNGGQFLLY